MTLGEAIERVVNVENHSSETACFHVYAMDFSVDREGDFTFSECEAVDGTWTADANCIDDPCSTGCCDMAGDANNSGNINILDVTYIINYLYKGGVTPVCIDEADANGSNTLNILDVTHIINFLYKGGPEPVCGTTGT